MTRFHRALLIYSGWILLSFPLACKGQLGSTVCVCSPATYEITFDFTRTCDNSALQGDGIVTSDCAVAPFQDDSVTDLAPVSVGSIDILELDENLVLLTQSSRFGTYRSGDSFPYESISRNPVAVNATSYPRALQVSVIGNNAAGDALFFAGLIVFVTDCSQYPNLIEGSTIGWIRFSKLETPNKQLCPASVPPTIVHDNPGYGLHSHSTSRSSSGSGSGSQKTTKTHRPTQSPTARKPKTYPPTKAPVATAHPTLVEEDNGVDCASLTHFGKKKGKKKKKKGKSGKHIRKKDKKGKYYYSDYYSECFESKHSEKRKKGSKKSKGEGKKKKSKSAFNYEEILEILHHHHSPMDRPVPAPTDRPIVDPVAPDTLDEPADPAFISSAAADLATANQQAQLPGQKGDFWGSPGYYFVLSLVVSVALAGVGLLYYNPRWAEERRPGAQLQREQHLSIMKGIDQWSNSGDNWVVRN